MVGFFNQKLSTPRVALPQEAFNSANEAHLAIIDARVARFKEALGTMKSLDKTIKYSLAITVAAWGINGIPFVPYIPFSLTVTLVGAFVLGFSLQSRLAFYEKYQKTFVGLKEVYAWAMGTRTDDYWYAIREKSVQNLILTLGPWVPKEMIVTWQPDDFIPSRIPQYLREHSPMRQCSEPSEEFIKRVADLASGVAQTANQDYRFYGENNMGNFSTMFHDYWEYLTSFISQAQRVSSQAGRVMAAIEPAPKPHNS